MMKSNPSLASCAPTRGSLSGCELKTTPGDNTAGLKLQSGRKVDEVNQNYLSNTIYNPGLAFSLQPVIPCSLLSA